MRTLRFKSNLGLGDSLISAVWMRRIVQGGGFRVVYHVPEHHRWQMSALNSDLPDFRLEPFQEAPGDAVQVPYDGPDRACGADSRDFVAVKLKQFDRIAGSLGFTSPTRRREDLLFDCPSLLGSGAEPVDFYVVNATPASWGRSVELNGMERLLERMKQGGHSVLCSNPSNSFPSDMTVDVFAKAARAVRAKAVVCVATGPCWPTFNALTEASVGQRIILCHELVDFGRTWPHFTDVGKAEEYLVEHRMLR